MKRPVSRAVETVGGMVRRICRRVPLQRGNVTVEIDVIVLKSGQSFGVQGIKGLPAEESQGRIQKDFRANEAVYSCRRRE